MAAVLGMITCIGGGVARDLLTLQVPTVLRAELYAVAAPAGAGSLSLGFALGLPHRPVALFGAGPLPLPAAHVDLPGLASANCREGYKFPEETN
jgi:uncharacterized membrane protein YeiH